MKKRNKSNEPLGLEPVSILSASATIKGEIKVENDFRVDGTIEGNIEGKGRIVIGPSGCVKGNIRSKHIELHGKILGDVVVSELVVLYHGSYYKGEITAKNLEIEAGAVFYGNCNMLNAEEDKSKQSNKTTSKSQTQPQA